MQQKVILITGASSGIGYDAALMLAEQGHKVYGAARRGELLEQLRERGVTPIRMDLTDEASMVDGVNSIIDVEGRIDVLINNAGYGYMGAIENVTIAEAKRQLEVNVFGLARLTQLVLPYMRKQHSGRIINTSSVAGKAVIPFGGWYNVSKYSVEALSDALRIEVKPFGIKVCLIEPGGIKTDWGIIAADNLEASSKETAYQNAGLSMARLLRKGYTSNLLSNPRRIAKAIARAVNAKKPRIRYRLGAGSGLIVFLHAVLPARWWDWIMRLVTSHALLQVR
ncbi:MAG: SDR family NAD(P)-dependent oxidoreductase [Bacteroidaceae bacterium]|nr:SDR family NAD(P)-dependent oxidoreductase [Bacteroidaceae bacterium]